MDITMNYSYEILKIEPRHKFLSVRYFADGKDNYFKNFNPEDFSNTAITTMIENFFHIVKQHWDYQASVDESVTTLEAGSTAEAVYDEAAVLAAAQPPAEDLPMLARIERDYRLQQTDWMMFSDTATPSQAWLDYRQALRDVPSQAGFPDNITWPTKPE